MSKIVNVVLLYGGKSGEHEISLRSAASVLSHLDTKKYRVTPIGIDKQGRYHLHDAQDLMNHTGSLPVSTERSKSLASLMNGERFVVDVDVVFPVTHGPLYEDGALQGVLELAGVAYVGCDVLASALSMDKDMARRVVCTQGLKSARYLSLSWHAPASHREQFCLDAAQQLGWPLFVKPCSLGSSVGIHKAKNHQELVAAVDDALRYDKEILVEEFIAGLEIELAVLENEQPAARPRVSIPGEIKVHHADGFYSYSAKYIESNQTDLIIPALLAPHLVQQLQDQAAHIFTCLKARGMARVDFFVNEQTEEIYFNELNTLPGFTSISMYPKLWEASGMSYAVLLDELISLAQTHHHCRQHLVTDYQ